MLSRVLINNLRAAGRWIGTPLGFAVLWLLQDWFFSTQLGAIVGLVGGSLALAALVAAVSGLFCVIGQ
jgi:hypothetical protein